MTQQFTMDRPHGLGGRGRQRVVNTTSGDVVFRGTRAQVNRWLEQECPVPWLDEIRIEADR